MRAGYAESSYQRYYEAVYGVYQRLAARLAAPDGSDQAREWVEDTLNQQLVTAILELNYGDTEMAPEITR